MLYFAIAALATIIVAVQHLTNWFLRKVWEDEHENNLVLSAVIVIIALGITIICFRFMLEWTLEVNIKTLLQ